METFDLELVATQVTTWACNWYLKLGEVWEVGERVGCGQSCRTEPLTELARGI